MPIVWPRNSESLYGGSVAGNSPTGNERGAYWLYVATAIKHGRKNGDGHTARTYGAAGRANMLSAPNQAVSRAIAFTLSTCVNNRARRTLGREHAT